MTISCAITRADPLGSRVHRLRTGSVIGIYLVACGLRYSTDNGSHTNILSVFKVGSDATLKCTYERPYEKMVWWLMPTEENYILAVDDNSVRWFRMQSGQVSKSLPECPSCLQVGEALEV
jgi:hypothetical protein